MTDSLSDDARLRATEAQMHRALGLHNTSQRKRCLLLLRRRQVHHIHNVGASSGMARFLSRSSTGIRVARPAPMRSKRHGRLCVGRSRHPGQHQMSAHGAVRHPRWSELVQGSARQVEPVDEKHVTLADTPRRWQGRLTSFGHLSIEAEARYCVVH